MRTAAAAPDMPQGKSSQQRREDDAARAAKAEARAAAAERELKALKAQQASAEAARRVENRNVKDKTAGSKLAASLQFNQDCVVQ